MQGYVYGAAHGRKAEAYPAVPRRVFKRLHARGNFRFPSSAIKRSVLSWRPQYDLHRGAKDWLERQGLYSIRIRSDCLGRMFILN